MKKITNFLVISNLLILVTFSSCNPIVEPPIEKVESVTSFYLLNEGSMGSNNASLDFYDYQTTVFSLNIFSQINPNIVGGLGDVGNDLKIYGSKLYAVINGSGLVEVMDAKTAQHIGVVQVENCRSINFHNGRAYVSSFAGATFGNGNIVGYVVEIDTTSLQVLRRVNVGKQPEEIEFLNGKMYVVNSGGYTAEFDNTISVVDLQSFTETKKIEVAVNLQYLRKDKNGNLYALSSGNYTDINPNIYVIKNDEVVKNLGIYATNFCISGDSIYVLSNETNWATWETTSKYVIYNIKTQQVVTENFITDGTEIEIATSYGIAVNPISKEIFITDAKGYTTSGELFCFSPEGRKLWSVRTGVCPKYITFLKE